MLSVKFGKKILKTSRPAFVMGILNVTPDSFYCPSRGGIERAFQLIDDGADILDIGGESTRPGYTPVDSDEEIKRIIPVIEGVRKKSDIVISVDTYKTEVMKVALEAGADVWNDVSFLKDGKKAATFIAQNELSYILMHNLSGSPRDLVNSITEKVKFLTDCGVEKEKIIIDPGIGFGKSNEECIEIIKNLEIFKEIDLPLLMALSRKRCIGFMSGRESSQRLASTLAANIISVQKSAKILRVHDVRETIDALNVMKYLE